EQLLQALDADLVDLAGQRERDGVGGGRDLAQWREAELRPAWAEAGPHRHLAGADPAVGHGDAQRQEPGGRAEESHEQIGESPAHESMVPAGERPEQAAPGAGTTLP